MDAISTHWNIVAAAIVLALVLLALWIIVERRRQTHRLQRRFGTEYGRTVLALGSQRKAESDLKAREKRAERLTIVPLSRRQRRPVSARPGTLYRAVSSTTRKRLSRKQISWCVS